MSDFTVPRKDKYTAQATPAPTVALIRDLYLSKRKSDGEIATELNRRDLRTRFGNPWDVSAVRRARYAESIYRPSPKARRPPDQDRDGLYSVHAVAARAGVKPAVIRYWARTGALDPVIRRGPGHPHWFRLDPATLDRLQSLAATYAQRRLPRSEDRQRPGPAPSPTEASGGYHRSS